MTTSRTPDWTEIRARYPAITGCTYLNTASRGLVSQTTCTAGGGYYQTLHDDPGAGLGNHWSPQLESARKAVADLISAPATSMAFVANASSGLNLAADLIAEPGEVVAHDEEFPSTTLPWQQRGHAVRFASPDDQGRVSIDSYASAITRNTRYIVVSAVQYASGYHADLVALRALCDQHGLRLIVDATQAVGAVEIDVRKFRPDMLMFSSYKWMCAGYGVAALYVSPQLLDEKPLPSVGWRSASDAYGLANRDAGMTGEAYGLELGNPVMPGPLVLGASAQELMDIGLGAIAQRVADLTARLHEGAQALGINIRSPVDPDRRGAITMLELSDSERTEAALRERGIHTSARSGRIRVSPHFYNEEDDIDRLLDALR